MKRLSDLHPSRVAAFGLALAAIVLDELIEIAGSVHFE